MQQRLTTMALAAVLLSPAAFAETARHVTVDIDGSGTPQTYNVVTADDLGNLRIEFYSASGNDVDASINPKRLQNKMVFQVADERMLVFDGGSCEAMTSDLESMPGMPAGGMDEVRSQMAEAQAEMQAMLEEMRQQDPAMAKMLEEQMKARMGGAMMMGGEPPKPMLVEKTSDTRKVGEYSTTRFVMRQDGADAIDSTVWAADIDDVEGGFIVNNAMIGMMEVFRDMMSQFGMQDLFASGMSPDVLEKMEDYYAVESEHDGGTTRLVRAETGVAADFFPPCN